jgi:nucleotide-binding universal stress UspA family protein
MTYATLMVHLELGRPNANLLKIVGDLAAKFHTGVIGITACQPLQLVYGDGYVSGDVVEQDQAEIQKEVGDAEKEFRSALYAHAGNVQWRSDVTMRPLSDYVAWEARSADLVITGVDTGASLFDTSKHMNVSDLVMRMGRPVLIVPADVDALKLERVVVAWKDTREARRAALDALPLLKVAGHVTVVEIAPKDGLAAARRRLDDVAAWLKRHGVIAEPLAVAATGEDADQLAQFVQERQADLMVAGAYGHSRLREWVLGGVTHDLLMSAACCSLVSH